MASITRRFTTVSLAVACLPWLHGCGHGSLPAANGPATGSVRPVAGNAAIAVPTASVVPAAWQQFSPPNAGASVLMPNFPVDKGQGDDAIWVDSEPPYAYEYAFTDPDMGSGPEAYMDKFAAGSGPARTTAGPTKITIQGHSGREYTQVDSDGTTIRTRVVVVGKRLFQYSVLSRTGNVNSPRVDKFFNSFQLGAPAAK